MENFGVVKVQFVPVITRLFWAKQRPGIWSNFKVPFYGANTNMEELSLTSDIPLDNSVPLPVTYTLLHCKALLKAAFKLLLILQMSPENVPSGSLQLKMYCYPLFWALRISSVLTGESQLHNNFLAHTVNGINTFVTFFPKSNRKRVLRHVSLHHNFS